MRTSAHGSASLNTKEAEVSLIVFGFSIGKGSAGKQEQKAGLSATNISANNMNGDGVNTTRNMLFPLSFSFVLIDLAYLGI